jgi:tRNA A37 threonylcarbamoyladenosine modification protein TsaB
VKLIGVSAMDALAGQAQRQGILGVIHIAVDAQRQEFNTASYRVSGESRELAEPLRLASLSEMRQRAAREGNIVGPGVSKWFGHAIDIEPAADAVGLLAAGKSGFVPGEQLEPIYVRETTFIKAPPPQGK